MVIYDGYLLFDEDADTAGVFGFDLTHFEVGAAHQAKLHVLSFGGEASLGFPAQKSQGLFSARCDTCWDFIRFNGSELSDAKGTPRNFFNGSTGQGIDLDVVDVSHLLSPGERSVRVTVGSGDGHVSLKWFD